MKMNTNDHDNRRPSRQISGGAARTLTSSATLVRPRVRGGLSSLVMLLLTCGAILLASQWLMAQNTGINAPAGAAAPAVPNNPGAAANGAATKEGKERIPTKNLLSVMQDGGPLMWPIAFCSFLLLVFVFERAISLRRSRVIPGPFVKRFLQQVSDGETDRDEALELCEQNKSPVAEVFAGAVKKWGKSAVEVEQALIDNGERVANHLRKYLRLFNGLSTITPLLGLLGTVMGIIESFNAMELKNEQAQRLMLAGGIAKALLTTAAGLCVAIPALCAYLFFVGRVDKLIIEIDAYGQELVNAIAADGVPSSSARSSAAERKRKTSRSESARGVA
jgi:biopolymer transport protein ExbB